MDSGYYNYQNGGNAPNSYWPQYYCWGQNASWQQDSTNSSTSSAAAERSSQTDFSWNNQHYVPTAPNSIWTQNTSSQEVPNHSATIAPKRQRAVYTRRQLESLERAYAQDRYISESNRKRLASELNVAAEQVRVWFQNRRAREKRRQRDVASGTEIPVYRQNAN
ncbi:Homeobox domain-containing protein [Aphelenchoides besseyi]|nr:Homeobox domain-containing protein [Aphelenchoides besseyi]KAI6200693.1 Homeobox domain-containing protein [Aphelenchoides besseyi]